MLSHLDLLGKLLPYEEPNAYTVNDGAFNCGSGNGQSVQPFNVIEPRYYPFTYPADPDNTKFGNDPHTGTILGSTSWLAISLQSSSTNSGSNGVYDPPDPPSLLSTLFTPIGQTSPEGNAGLGVYRPAFFEGWPFPRVTCDLSYGDYNGYTYNGGCNWSAAAPSLEALPAPLAAISITTASISQTKTQATVVLAIHNSGTQDIASIDINTIAPVGKHNATLIGPALPIHIGKVLRGTFGTIALTLDVPPSVKDLQLQETGTVHSEDGSAKAFSLQQSILTKK